MADSSKSLARISSAFGHNHAAPPAGLQAVHHVFDEQDFGGGGGAHLHILDDAVLVNFSAEGRIGENHVIAVQGKPQIAHLLSVESRRQGVPLHDADVGEATECQVHSGKAHHLGVHVVAVEGLVLEPGELRCRQSVPVAAPLELAVDLPIVGTNVPMVGFFLLAPFLLFECLGVVPVLFAEPVGVACSP